MALNARVNDEEFGQLSEAEQAHYAKDTESGEYVLEVKPVGTFELADTGNLKTALQRERSRASELEKAKKRYEEQFGDLDPDQAREALKKVEEMDNWDPDQKLKEHKERFEQQVAERYEQERKKIEGKLNQTVEERDAQIQQLHKQLEQQLISSTATQAITEHKGSVKLLLPLIRHQTRMVKDEDGNVQVVVVDEKGEPRISTRSSSTGNMTIEELVEEMKNDKEFARAFEGSGGSGSGGHEGGSGGRGGVKNPWKKDSFNLTEQARLTREEPEKAKRLRAEAGAA